MRLYLALFVVALARLSYAEEAKKPPAAQPVADAKKDHIMVTPTEFTWVDGPPAMPPGQKMVVLEGDPAKPGPYTIRAKLPAGYKVPPHWHPGIEHVTVLEGTMGMGYGEKWDDKEIHEAAPGSFMAMEVGTKHYFLAKTAGVIQVHGNGPFGITYVNPADDPMKKAAPAKKGKK